MRVSYLEIYNENIKDLLSIEDKNLDLREDPSQGVLVSGITEIECASAQEIIALLKVIVSTIHSFSLTIKCVDDDNR